MKCFKNFVASPQCQHFSLRIVLRKKKNHHIEVAYFILFPISSSKKVYLLEQILILDSSHGTMFTMMWHDGLQLSVKHILLYTFLYNEFKYSCLIHTYFSLDPLLSADDYLSFFSLCIWFYTIKNMMIYLTYIFKTFADSCFHCFCVKDCVKMPLLEYKSWVPSGTA